MNPARWLRHAGWYERAAVALAAAVFAMNVYRAATQSITIDEAFAYNNFVAGPLADLVKSYDASNHVLYTLAAKLSTTLLETSEFTLRLPSLLAGLFYLVTALRFCRFLFGRRAVFLLGFAALVLNPFVLDYLSAARGYGMALAFWLWALFEVVRFESDRELHRAALGLGLSVASNLAFLFPSVALAGLVFVRLGMDALLSGGRAAVAKQLARAADHFAVPALVTAFLIMVAPFARAQRENFYFGEKTLSDTVASIVDAMFFHDPLRFFERSRWGSPVLTAVEWAILLLLTAAAASLAMVGYRWLRTRGFCKLALMDQFLFWSGGCILVTLAGLVAAHVLFGVLYPRDRTALYWAPLLTLFSFALFDRGPRMLRLAGLAAAGLCLIVFAAQFDTPWYSEWRHDAGTRRVVEALRADHALHPAAGVRVGTDWLCSQSLSFYRHVWHLDWIAPLDGKGPDGEYDYYVLLPDDRPLLAKRKLVKIYSDAVSGAVLAARR